MQYPLGYYRLIQSCQHDPECTDDEQLDDGYVGQLFYLLEINSNEIVLLKGDTCWTVAQEEFEDCFQFAPDGLVERNQKMGELMNSFHSASVQQDHLLTSSKTPKLLADVTKPLKESNSRNLALVGEQNAVSAAGNLKKIKTAFAHTKAIVVRRQKELAELVREQTLILEYKTKALTKQIKLAEEAIYMINAYLGKDEKALDSASNRNVASALSKVVDTQNTGKGK